MDSSKSKARAHAKRPDVASDQQIDEVGVTKLKMQSYNALADYRLCLKDVKW